MTTAPVNRAGFPPTPATGLQLDTSAYAMRLGDDALVLAQRLAEWSSRAPSLEEDIALSNIGLDLLGQARALLGYAGEAEGTGRDEDALAFLRQEAEFTNCQLVEQPNGDFAATITRQLLFSAYQLTLYRQMAASNDPTLAAVAAKGVKEVDYHLEHASGWVLRLGDGTEESRARIQDALVSLWPFTHELFEADDLTARLVASGVAVDPAGLRGEWERAVQGALEKATLGDLVPRLVADGWRPGGGRLGRHTEHLGFLLAEMQHLHRSHPGARW